MSIRTLFWTPAVGEEVRPKRLSKIKGTIEEVKDLNLWGGYCTPNNLAKQKQMFSRKDLSFDYRPAPRRSA